MAHLKFFRNVFNDEKKYVKVIWEEEIDGEKMKKSMNIVFIMKHSYKKKWTK